MDRLCILCKEGILATMFLKSILNICIYIYICSIYNIINTVYLKPLNKLRIRLGILYMHGSLSSLLNERDRTVAVDGIHSVRVTDRSAMFFGVLWAVHLRA